VLADHSLGRVAVRSATLAAVVLIVAVPVYVYVEPSWRAFVARLACAFVLGVALLQFRRALLDRLADLDGSALETLTPDPLPRPPGRPGRGPSLASLRRVIVAIEKRS
jgi:hypothetical protein